MACLKLNIPEEKSTALKVVHKSLRDNENSCIGAYRFGFNGMEKDDEIAGSGNSYTAKFWEYDPRIARRWNLDPKPIASESRYAVFRNNPIMIIDPDGDFGKKSDERKEKRHQKARAKFDEKVSQPLRDYETGLKRDGVSGDALLSQVQGKADELADKYQNKTWLHHVAGIDDADKSYTSSGTGVKSTQEIQIKAYITPPPLDVPISADRTQDGLTNSANTGVIATPGSSVNIQFNPYGIPNSLDVSTQQTSGGSTTIATTGSMIRSNITSGWAFSATTQITTTNSGEISYVVRNTSASASGDHWGLQIQVIFPAKLNPYPYAINRLAY